MVNLTPIQPNFYGRSKAAKTVGLQSVQSASNVQRGTGANAGSSRGSSNRSMPGTVNLSRQLLGSSTIGLQGLVGAIANTTANLIDSALNPDAVYGTNSSYSYYNPYGTSSSNNRLSANGLPPGGTYGTGLTDSYGPIDTFRPIASFNEAKENRVIITDQTNLFVIKGGNKLLAPLEAMNGVLFPYTPVIGTSHRANYEVESLVHTNYGTPYYTNSTVDSINVQARFTAQTPDEAAYIIAMIRFFRTATKMFYGGQQNRGTPPPVLYFDAHGQYLFDHIPVVIKEFQVSMPNDVNYITATINDIETQVPVDLNVTIDMIPTYSRDKISNNFDLIKYSNGKLLGAASGTRTGGWI